MKRERRRILFSGRVQGVGFRMTAVQLSRDLPLAGTVRNTPDGRVELIVEGPADEVDALISRLGEHFGAFVRTVEQTLLDASPDAGSGEHHQGVRVIS